MKKFNLTKIFLLIILSTIFISLGMAWHTFRSMSNASWQSIDSGGETRCTLLRCVPFHNPDTEIRELLGMSQDNYYERVHLNRESLVDLADESDVDIQDIIEILLINETAWIDEMVIDGFYTPAQAEAAKENLIGKISLKVYSPFKDPFEVAADAIKVDSMVLMNSLGEGLTPADFAVPYNVSPDDIYQAVLKADLNHIDAQVKYGIISESDAESARLDAEKFAHKIVYKKWFYQRLIGRSIVLLPIYFAAKSLGFDT